MYARRWQAQEANISRAQAAMSFLFPPHLSRAGVVLEQSFEEEEAEYDDQ
jgi:hypothetical protein